GKPVQDFTTIRIQCGQTIPSDRASAITVAADAAEVSDNIQLVSTYFQIAYSLAIPHSPNEIARRVVLSAQVKPTKKSVKCTGDNHQILMGRDGGHESVGHVTVRKHVGVAVPTGRQPGRLVDRR